MSKSGNVIVNIMSGFSRWWLSSAQTLVLVFILTLVLPFACSDDPHSLQNSNTDTTKLYYSYINISYFDRDTKKDVFKKFEGKYGKRSIISSASGVVMHTISFSVSKSGTNNFGCTNYINSKFPQEHWIALVERGECSFTNKIRIATKEHNATAIVIYSNETNEVLATMDHDKAIPSISAILSQADGKEIAHLLDLGHKVHMQIIPGPEVPSSNHQQNSISKTSVLFVSISFIVLMIISLAWLVFYYIQRFRYSHAKERLARRLVCAAKKAIAKIPQRTVKVGDKELDSEFDQCAVCIEPYKAHDVIRILPCRHVFHKSCVDPWLLDQRSCPMCKLDILRAFGMQIGGSQESVHPDVEAGPVAVAVQEPEISSSVEDTQTEEIKVLLVPHACLHFRSGCDKVGAAGDEEVSSSLLGAVGGSVPRPSTTNSHNSKAGRSYSRAEKSDKVESVSSEIKSLIGKGQGRWQSKQECHEDEDEDVDVDDNVIRDIKRLVNVIETVNCDHKKEVMKTHEDDVDVGRLDTSSTLSLPPPQPASSSSEQFKIHACETCDEGSGSWKKDEQINRDSGSLTITIGDDSIHQGAIVKAEILKHDDIVGMESRT